MITAKKNLNVAWALSLCLLMLLSAVMPLRLHVVANSDSAVDQAVKLQVRDAVLQEIGAADTMEAAVDKVLQKGEQILAAAEAALAEAGADYTAKLYLGTEEFPRKTYGNLVFPQGKYTALRVVLGEGAGQNWWCVIYPPLCLGADYTRGNKVEFKSFFGELFDRLFGKEAT